MGVGYSFERRESLRRNDEESFGCVEIADSFYEGRSIDVGNKPEGHAAFAIVPQRLVGHDGAEIGAADANVNYIANAFTSVTLPRAVADPVRESCHLVEHGVHLGYDVPAVYDD